MKAVFNGRVCKVAFSSYETNANTAVLLLSEDEEDIIAIATVNGNRSVPRHIVGIKDWSENTGMVEALISSNVIQKQCVDSQKSGFVLIRYFELTKEAVAELDRVEE